MTYRIARNGELFGPYSLIELQRYIASGRVILTDLAQGDGMEEWLPISELFPAPPPHHITAAGSALALYPNPPDLPWWVALILGIVTVLGFFVVWDIVEAAWLRRVERPSTALGLYIAVGVLYLLKLPTALYNLGLGPGISQPYSTLITVTSLVLLIVSRFVFRNELLRHFNGPEPIGLRLNGLLTLLFGGLYFQYHFNRINEVKRALHVSVPTA
jgi:predicted membrane channel-forming protein YqfA (hemolysin III family)